MIKIFWLIIFYNSNNEYEKVMKTMLFKTEADRYLFLYETTPESYRVFEYEIEKEYANIDYMFLF